MDRKHFPGMRIAAASVFGAAILSACVTSPPRGAIYVRTRPPAAIVEVRGSAPDAGHEWIPGYHAWRGNEYVWVPGHWDRRPRPHAVWVSGQWRQHGDGWYWVEGHWKK